jgi:hypothetical protein
MASEEETLVVDMPAVAGVVGVPAVVVDLPAVAGVVELPEVRGAGASAAAPKVTLRKREGKGDAGDGSSSRHAAVAACVAPPVFVPPVTPPPISITSEVVPVDLNSEHSSSYYTSSESEKLDEKEQPKIDVAKITEKETETAVAGRKKLASSSGSSPTRKESSLSRSLRRKTRSSASGGSQSQRSRSHSASRSSGRKRDKRMSSSDSGRFRSSTRSRSRSSKRGRSPEGCLSLKSSTEHQIEPRYGWTTSMNSIISHLVLGPEADAARVKSFIKDSPAHIIVCVCLCASSAVAGMLQAASQGVTFGHFIPERIVSHLYTYDTAMFVVHHLGHVNTLQQKSVMEFGHDEGSNRYSFASFSFMPRHPNTAVAVGVFSGPATSNVIPEKAIAFMRQMIEDESIRFLVGVFGDTGKQMQKLCRSCGAAGKGAMHQPWKMKEGDVRIYPSYIFVFGCAKEVKMLPPNTEPEWTDFLELRSERAVTGKSEGSATSRSSGHAAVFEAALLPVVKLPCWGWAPEKKCGIPWIWAFANRKC